MTRFITTMGAFGAALLGFWIALKSFARSQRNLGGARAAMEQQAQALEGIEDGKRIQDQIDKDLAALTPDERAVLLRNKFTRH